MQTSLTFSGTAKDIAAIMAAISTKDVANIDRVSVQTEAAIEGEPRRGRGRPRKEAAAVLADFAEDSTDTAEAAPEEDADTGFEEEPEEEEEPAPPVAAKKNSKKALDVDTDILPAYQAYAKKHSREKATKVLSKVLNKHKVKSVRNLPAAVLPEVLELLKV